MLATAFLFWGITVHATPTYFLGSAGTGAATTTLVYQTAGAATTTEVFDAGKSLTTAADSAVLLLQFVGSSTAATQRTIIEYAQGENGLDCLVTPSSCDWYFGFSTTTNALGNKAGGAVGISSTTSNIITVPTPTRYVRAVLSIPGGGVNGAVWAKFIAKKQN